MGDREGRRHDVGVQAATRAQQLHNVRHHWQLLMSMELGMNASTQPNSAHTW